MTIIAGFEQGRAALAGIDINYVKGGSGPPVLLLHGFPQTHAMWHAVAPVLARYFTVIAADLRGYGDSSKPDGAGSQSFRNMAADQRALMTHLGYASFHLVGHDRGAQLDPDGHHPNPPLAERADPRHRARLLSLVFSRPALSLP
jgi:haloacetate dehalogenase